MSQNGSIRTPCPVLNNLCIFLLVTLSTAVVASTASAQSLIVAGSEGRTRIAINRAETFQRPDGSIQARLFEVTDRRHAGVAYAVVAADYDCVARLRTVTLRVEFSSARDPVTTAYRPGRTTSADESPSVSRQLTLLCQNPLPTATMSVEEFLRHSGHGGGR